MLKRISAWSVYSPGLKGTSTPTCSPEKWLPWREAVTSSAVFFVLRCFSCLSVSLCIMTEHRYRPVETRVFHFVPFPTHALMLFLFPAFLTGEFLLILQSPGEVSPPPRASWEVLHQCLQPMKHPFNAHHSPSLFQNPLRPRPPWD